MTNSKASALVDALARRIIDEISPSRLVIGLSGGADSTLALLVCRRVRDLCPSCFVQAVHCIHGLDADDPVWLAHCQKLCRRVDVPLKTPKLHIVYGNGRSPEEVSRSERYAALLRELKGGALVLGHQADDQCENLFLALKRGSGPHGLSGMRFITRDERGTVLRPLLSLTKKQIEEIIEALDFDFVYDISNSYLKFERNFIRLKVLPLIKERFPSIEKAVLRSQKLCAYEHDLAVRYAKPVFESAFQENHTDDPYLLKFDFSKLDTDDEPLMLTLLRMFWMSLLTLPPELEVLMSSLNLMRISADQFGVVKHEGLELRRYKNSLYLMKPCVFPERKSFTLKQDQSLRLGDFIYTLKRSSEKEAFSLDGDEVILDFDLKGSQKLKPVHRAHAREIKKLMSEYAVPYFMRQKQCLVKNCSGMIVALGDLCACVKSESVQQSYELKIQRAD